MKVSSDYPTRCATEWHLRPATYWLSHIYIRNADGCILFPFGPPCLNGLLLRSLLRRAQIAVFFADELTPAIIQQFVELDDDAVQGTHVKLGVHQRYTKNEIYIELWSPDLPTFEMTLVDLPGKLFCYLTQY